MKGKLIPQANGLVYKAHLLAKIERERERYEVRSVGISKICCWVGGVKAREGLRVGVEEHFKDKK